MDARDASHAVLAENSATERSGSRIPIALKIVYGLFVAVLIPVYWTHLGPANFLWFSDIALFTTLLAVWLENRLLASMMAVGVLLPESAWTAGFLWQLAGGEGWLFDAVEYMFDPALPWYVRGLSLFHLALPPLLLWLVWKLGYDRRALAAQTALAWTVLAVAFAFTDPPQNINWVHGWGYRDTQQSAGWPHFLFVMAGLPVLVYLPTHLLLRKLFGRGRAPR